MHVDQAQRLRTQELEEKVVKLEYALDMAMMESRVQSGYIANLKVYEGIVNGYVLQLKERLEVVDPGCRLLEVRIPAMPEQSTQHSGFDSAETSPEASGLLSDIVNGMIEVYCADCRYAGGWEDGGWFFWLINQLKIRDENKDLRRRNRGSIVFCCLETAFRTWFLFIDSTGINKRDLARLGISSNFIFIAWNWNEVTKAEKKLHIFGNLRSSRPEYL
jgi:hypothetical protein